MCQLCDQAEALLGYRDICPTSGKLEFSHKMLVDIGAKFLKGFGCGIVLKELVCLNETGEIPDIYGIKFGYSILIECKTSRADFLADKRKTFRAYPEQGMGQYRAFLCPEDIIKQEDLTDILDGWGLLYVNQKRKIERVIFPKQNYLDGVDSPMNRFKANLRAERSLLFSALRRKQGGE
ncbi:MAG: hypothetical protein AB7F25_06830 [Deferribacterales bacterium]